MFSVKVHESLKLKQNVIESPIASSSELENDKQVEISSSFLEDSNASESNLEIAFTSGNPRVEILKGLIHLYRNTSEKPSSINNFPCNRTEYLCVLAVPNYMTGADFCQFCGSFLSDILELKIVRNDSSPERYMVLIKFKNQKITDEFFIHFSGKRYSSMEAEICHVLFVADVEYTDSEKHASIPPSGFTELPNCPVCLERLDCHISGILTTVCNHSFHSNCISKWSDSSCPVCRYCQENDKSSCMICDTSENLWICLICGFIGCGRYREGHAVNHWKETQHCYSLELDGQRVWDYVGDNYVHRLIQSKTDGKIVEVSSPYALEEASRSSCSRCNHGRGCKVNMNGSNVHDQNSSNVHVRNEDESCNEDVFSDVACDCPSCQRQSENSSSSDLNKALLDSKFEAMAYEYNHLLSSQLESQRQYFEGLLSESNSKKEAEINKAVEKTMHLKIQKIQNKLEKIEKEKQFLQQVNESLVTNQKQWQEKFKMQEEREKELVNERDEKIKDLEEQVRDLMIFIEAKKTLEASAESSDLRESTVLPVPIPVPVASSEAPKPRASRRNRRR